MSQIDEYRHTCIGVVACPSRYPIVYGNDIRKIHLYRLDQAAEDWQAKPGDVLLGGGSGEAAALYLAIPEAIRFFTSDWDDYEVLGDVYHAYWSPNEAYVLGDGYRKLGWHPEEVDIVTWLAEHVVAFLMNAYPDQYKQFCGDCPLEQDGSICCKPSSEEWMEPEEGSRKKRGSSKLDHNLG